MLVDRQSSYRSSPGRWGAGN